MNVGILYPRSNAHPAIGFDFLDGLKAVLKQSELNDQLRLFTEGIEFGGSEKEVYTKAEKLLMLDGVDVLVAYIDLKVLPILQPLLYASGKLTIIVNPGANYPQNWIPQPNVISLTGQHAFLCWLTGKLAARKPSSTGLMATTFYDCGYLHATAMVNSFRSSGGEISFNYVNNKAYNEAFDINELTAYLSTDNSTDNLLCIFDTLPASLLYKQLNGLATANRLHLFVSPMMLEPRAIESREYHFSIEGYSSWLAAVENPSNLDFIETYKKHTRKEPGIFSVFGWETGLILEKLFRHSGQNYHDGEALAGQLCNQIIDSPRGELKLDPGTLYYLAPVYKCKIPPNTVEWQPEMVTDNAAEWNSFINEPLEGVVSGWTNTYLCY